MQPVYRDILEIGRYRNNAILLEVGCGRGYLVEKLAPNNKQFAQSAQSPGKLRWMDSLLAI